MTIKKQVPEIKKESTRNNLRRYKTYWSERMLGARPRTRRAAKRNEMERVCVAN